MFQLKSATKRVAAMIMGSTMIAAPIMMGTAQAWAEDGETATTPESSITIGHVASNEEVTYNIYKLFSGIANENNTVLGEVEFACDDADKGKFVEAVKKGMENVTFVSDDAKTKFFASIDDLTAQEIADTMTEVAKSDSKFAAKFAAGFVPEAKKLNLPVSGTIKNNGEAQVLSDGYYLFANPDDPDGGKNDTIASGPILQIIGGQGVTVTEKTSVPTLDKQVREDSAIIEGNDESGWGEAADATTNQVVDYRLTGTFPSNISDYVNGYSYTINDNWNDDELSVSADDVEIYLDDAEVARDQSDGDIVTIADGEMKISFNFTTGTEPTDGIKLSDGSYVVPNADSKLVVNYKGKLVSGTVHRANNKAYIEYSNNPSNTEATGTTPTDKVSLYDYQINLHKQDQSTGDPLAGIGFTVKNAAGLYIIDNGDGTAKEVPETDLSEDKSETIWTTDDNGNLRITGLDVDTYTLEEVSTLTDAGYVLPEGDAAKITVTLTATYAEAEKTSASANVSGSDELVAVGIKGECETVMNEIVMGDNNEYVSGVDNVYVTMGNKKNIGLPITGQMGTYMLIGAGAVLLIGGGIYMARRNKQDDIAE